MKEVKHYICEICGTEYKEKMKCQKCEKSHIMPSEIVRCHHLSLTQNAKGYPDKVTIKMSDGLEVIYHR